MILQAPRSQRTLSTLGIALQFLPLATLVPEREPAVQPPPTVLRSAPQCRYPEQTLTTLRISEGVDTINTSPTVRDTTHGLTNRASRLVTSSPRDTLRTTPAREGPAHTITLDVGRLADALGRVCNRRGGITIPTIEVTGTLETAEGNGMGWVVTFLFVLLALNLWQMREIRRCTDVTGSKRNYLRAW